MPPVIVQNSRRPFVEVVRDYVHQISRKDYKVFQSTANVEHAEDERSFEELLEQVMLLSGMQDKLLFACKNGSDQVTLSLMKHMLEQTEERIDIATFMDKNANNCTLLHICAQKNKVHSMEYLLQNNVPIESTDAVGATPLLYAVAHNCQESTAYLLSNGANANVRDSYNKFPLLIALKNKHYNMAELITMFPYDVHLKGAKGNTVLHSLVEDGDLRAVQFLVEKCNASPLRRNNDEENVLFHCLPHIEITQYLATYFERNGLTKMFLHINSYGRNLIHESCENGFFDSMLILLKSINMNDMSSSQICDMLNEQDKFGSTPLITAVRNGRREMVQFLTDCSELKLNQGDQLGHTALYYALNAKDKPLISILKAAGCSLRQDVEDESDSTKSRLFHCCRSLNLLLVVIMVATAALSIVAIAAVTFSFFATTVKANTRQIRSRFFAEVMLNIESSAREFTQASVSGVSLVKSKIDPTNLDEVTAYIYPQFGANRRISILQTVSCGLVDGRLSVIQKDPNRASGVLSYNNYNNIYTLAVSTVTDVDNRVIDNSTTRYVPVTNSTVFGPWVAVARDYNTTRWTPSYSSSSTRGFLVVNLVHPINTNGLSGFCASAVSTEFLGKFLKQAASSIPGSMIIIVERQTGFLIATSDASILLTQTNGTTTTRLHGVDSPNVYLRNTIRYVEGHYGAKVQIPSRVVYSEVEVKGKPYLLNIGLIEDEYGMDWAVMQLLPNSFFLKQFHNTIIIMCCVTVAIIILSALLSALIAWYFMSPLKSLVRQADYVRSLQLEKVEKSMANGMSPFSEIRALQLSFVQMTKRLKQFRLFIPDHILSVIEAEASADVQLNDVRSSTKSDSDALSGSSLSVTSLKGMVSNALNSSLTSGSITVMTVEFEDLTDLLESHTGSELQEVTKDILTALQNSIRSSKGQFVNITSRKATIAWNTFIGQSDHRLRACKGARSFIDNVRKCHDNWRKNNLPVISVSVGLSSGTAHFGNLSSDKMKFFTVVGLPVIRSEMMMKVNRTWNTTILCSDEIYTSVKEEFEFRPIDKLVCREETVQLYELGDMKPGDQWPNELDKEYKGKWSNFNEGYELYEMNNIVEAAEKFKVHCELYPEDSVSSKMVDICK